MVDPVLPEIPYRGKRRLRYAGEAGRLAHFTSSGARLTGGTSSIESTWQTAPHDDGTTVDQTVGSVLPLVQDRAG